MKPHTIERRAHAQAIKRDAGPNKPQTAQNAHPYCWFRLHTFQDFTRLHLHARINSHLGA